MNTPHNDWEKEFEESFGLDHPIRTFRDHDDYLLVRDFIRQTLATQRERMVEEVMQVPIPRFQWNEVYDIGAKEMKKNIITIIKGEK